MLGDIIINLLLSTFGKVGGLGGPEFLLIGSSTYFQPISEGECAMLEATYVLL